MNTDLHTQITNIIIKQLEKGVTPWRKPWVGGEALKMPVNGTNKRNYNGINIPLLWSSSIDQNFNSNEWASFQQWKEKKEFIRKGEKGTMIVFADTFEVEKDDEIKKIPFLKSYHVFNKQQLQSYKPEEIQSEKTPLNERITNIDQFVQQTKAIIEHGQQGAYYNPVSDKIGMPYIDKFKDMPDLKAAEAYYSTLFHEITHWTGHKDRLDRKLTANFGSEPYAKEELVAELGSSFLGSEFDIEKAPVENHVAYIQNWIQKLSKEPSTIVVASSQASKAVEYLHKEH